MNWAYFVEIDKLLPSLISQFPEISKALFGQSRRFRSEIAFKLTVPIHRDESSVCEGDLSPFTEGSFSTHNAIFSRNGAKEETRLCVCSNGCCKEFVDQMALL